MITLLWLAAKGDSDEFVAGLQWAGPWMIVDVVGVST
jgi:hypothetical protein